MAFSDLEELAAALKAAAGGGALRLDETFLAPRVLALLRRSLPPSQGSIELSANPATKVSLGDDRSQVQTLWIQNAALPQGVQQAPLRLAGCQADVAIRQTVPGNATGYDLVLRLKLPSGWTFGDSLPPLWGLQAPTDLATPAGQLLYFSSFEAARSLPVFPDDPQSNRKLATGLTYFADLELTGVFAAAEELLGLGKITLPLSGTITPGPETPELDLRAYPQADPLSIGFLELGVPFIGVRTTWVDLAAELEPPSEDVLREPLLPAPAIGGDPPAKESYPTLLFYVGADIEVAPDSGKEGVPIEIQAIFADPEPKGFVLAIGAPPGKKLSLGSLATKLLGSDGDALKAGAGSLDSYLDSIALEAFSAYVVFSPKLSIQYLTAQIGTSPPWELKLGSRDPYKLDLTFTWTTVFSPQTASMAAFEAVLQISEKLAFDVVVTLPELTITGSERGTVELSLSDLKEIFPLEIPSGLLDLTLTNFTVALATDAGGSVSSFSLAGVAGLSIAPFGTPLLALENVQIALAVDPKLDQHTLNLDGTIVLGGALKIAGSATVTNVPGDKTVFSLHLVDETVGSMLNHLVHLVDPTFDLTLPAPWDRFLAISLDAFVLEVDLTDNTVSLDYEETIDLEFLTVTKLGLTYEREPKDENGKKKPPGTKVEIEGTFLGIEFGKGKDKANPPLAWDPVNESPPSVPGKTSVLDLRYAGLGQHIGFSGKQPETIPAVIERLETSVLPVQPGQMPALGGGKDGELGFQAGAGWLIGTDLTVMGTVSIAAIFNDPNLYGVKIGLDGKRAGAFAGLRFEILYRKVTETIGVYHLELTLPTAMRTLQFGAASLTLPIVTLDVYTNGNFRVDLGFPKGLDFSRSFCLQLFPFIGYGGLYFALLDGATSSRVPQITNGTFHPVVEFGVGLSVGVGKTIDEGVLSGGLSVTVTGVLEGVLAWFHPTDSSPEETYYQLHGNIAVVGHLYATIDFAIIQASIDVTATLAVTLAIESHQPIHIEASASVSVRVSVKIVFFTIHLSFDATISASFTIGSATPTPWKPAAPQGGAPSLEARAGRRMPAPAIALPLGHRRAIRRELVAGTVTPIGDWPAVRVFPDGPEKAELWAITAFTKGEGPSGNDPRAIVLMGAENSIPEGALSAAEHRQVAGESPGAKAFNVLIEAMLRWGVYVETHPAIAATNGAVRKGGTTTIVTDRPHGFRKGSKVTLEGVGDPSFDGNVTVGEVLTPTSFASAQQKPDATSGGGNVSSSSVSAEQLEDLRQALGLSGTVAAAFDPTTLKDFLAANVELEVNPAGSAPGAGAGKARGVSVFPMLPWLSLADSAGTSVDFAEFEAVTPDYQKNVRAYFESLQVRFEAADEPGDGAAAALAATPAKTSMAAVVFSQYFNMLMSQGAKAAIDLLAALPFTIGAAPMSVGDVATALEDPALAAEPLRILAPNQAGKVLREGAEIALPDATRQVRSGDTFAGIATALTELGVLDPGGKEYTAATLLEANAEAAAEPAGIFDAGVAVAYDEIAYTTQPADTLDLVAARLIVRIGGAALLNGIPQLAAAVKALQGFNPSIPGATAAIEAGTPIALEHGSYTAVDGDTLTQIAAYFLAPAVHAIAPEALVGELLAANDLDVTDPAKEQPVGTSLKIPPLERTTAPGDSVKSIARTLIAPTAPIAASLLALEAAGAKLLSPHAVLATPLLYRVAQEDTPMGIATKLGLTLAELSVPAAKTPGLFAPGAKVTVEDVPSLDVEALMEALLEAGEWNTAAGMVSRFMLSGLRLPDPKEPGFEKLTPEQLRDPQLLAKIETKPLYALVGQQFPIAAAPAAEYELTLSKPSTGFDWLKLGGGASVSYPLTEKERTLLSEVASTAVEPGIKSASRLALLRMLPQRTALRQQIVWQAAEPPAGAAGNGNPSLWMLPQHLLEAVAGDPKGAQPPLYELGVTANALPGKVGEAGPYAWGTLVDLTISLPQTEGDAPAAANAYVVEGADDTGARLLQQLHLAVENGASPKLLLLYQPDPAGPVRNGLASDVLRGSQTWVLKANLTTLTSSGKGQLPAAREADPTGAYTASIEDAGEFLALLWEASITRSGGFYLNYVNENGGAGLPGTLFGSGSTARLSLLAFEPGRMNSVAGPLEPFHNCAVVANSVDPAGSTLVAQPVTCEVTAKDSLTSVQQAFAAHKPGITVTDVARINASVPQLLRPGAELAIPGEQNPYPVRYGDTLASIVAAHSGLTLEALVATGENATAAIFAPAAEMQLTEGTLAPAATAPPGTVGFEVVRPDPDPGNLPYEELKPAALVSALYNLLAWRLEGHAGFSASGEGLSTTPTQAGEDWSYAQSLAAAPFAESTHGSASAALPPPAANPYNGIEAGRGGEPRIGLALQDVYGNRRPLPGFESVETAVGYFDDVVGLSAWPSLAISYLVEEGPSLAFAMTLQQDRYVPSPSVSVASALAAIEADLASYRRVHYQLAQPDFGFTLRTTLAVDAAEEPRAYPLAKTPFLAFARGAYLQLAALGTLEAVEFETGSAARTVEQVKKKFGVSAAQLLRNNQDQPYPELFGELQLQVPAVYTTVEDDTLATIAAHANTSVAEVAKRGERVPLNEGAVLATPNRTQEAPATGRLADAAQAAHASVPGLAVANGPRSDILNPGVELALGTATYTTVAGDTLEKAAAKLGSTVEAVAVANQFVTGLLVAGTELAVSDALVAKGETLASLARAFDPAGGATGLAETNAKAADLFAPATSLVTGTNSSFQAAQPSDTLLTFAQANHVTVDQLAAANESAEFAGAKLEIPGRLQQGEGKRWCSFSARATDTLEGIAKLFGVQPAELAALNPDVPGLLAAGQTVRDSASGASVATVADDTFEAIATRFEQQHGVQVTLAQLANDVATQAGLLAPGGLWICPPMQGDAYGHNQAHSLAGLASAYGTDAEALAAANAATPGLLAAGVTLALPGWPADKPPTEEPIVTIAGETFNTLVTRLEEAGVSKTVSEVATEVGEVTGLIDPAASPVPVPPPSPDDAVAIAPSFGDAAFQLVVQVAAERDTSLVHPDFAGAASVVAASSAIAPHPDPDGKGDTLGLADFAARLQKALPGLSVAMGDPAVEHDPAASSTVWCVNFGSSYGPELAYELSPATATCFALPPLSPSLTAGTVTVRPYASAGGLAPEGEARTFQAVDLDNWLDRFLAAVDVFLSPAYAVPAYAASPKDVEAVVQAKQELADAISRRITNVLAPPKTSDDVPLPSRAAAVERMRQAMLQRLGNASTVSTLVQLPASVPSSPSADPLVAPRLSGRLVPPGDPAPQAAPHPDTPQSYSFSTAKLPLTKGGSTATFLFTVKAPADQSHVTVEAGYAVSEIELPDPGSKIGDYEGSSWLRLILPPQPAPAMKLEIPVPLRAYPSPVTLVSQSAKQSVEQPQSARELAEWDFDFVYQHDDAQQDSTLVEVAFDPRSGEVQATGDEGEIDLQAVFAALAQFTSVEQPLADDLARLAMLPPGGTHPITTKAVESFAAVATGVAKAFARKPELAAYLPPPETFYYQLVREQTDATADAPAMLSRLVVTAIDPATGKERQNPLPLWPTVWARLHGLETRLRPVGDPSATKAVYEFPAGIPADTVVEEHFRFAFGEGAETEDVNAEPPPPATAAEATLAGPQTFSFECVDAVLRQNARAGVSIWRNWSLLPEVETNPAFVYRTPIARFPALATPAVLATDPIALGKGVGPRAPLAQALGEFFQELTARGAWQAGDTLSLRLGAGYRYAVATGGASELASVVPIFLVPSYDFHPAAGGATGHPADWDWTASESFVSQVASMVETWRGGSDPSSDGGAFVFDFTLYAGGGQLQPLIHATGLEYALATDRPQPAPALRG